MTQMKCCVCGSTEEDLRPYGPKCATICFDCMTATPQREAEAKQNFYIQLDACGDVAVIGGEAGPVPIEHSQLASGKDCEP